MPSGPFSKEPRLARPSGVFLFLESAMFNPRTYDKLIATIRSRQTAGGLHSRFGPSFRQVNCRR